MAEKEAGQKVIVHRGATIATGEFSNVRVDYTVEAEVPSGMTVTDVIMGLETMLDDRISKQRENAQQHYHSAKSEEADLEKLPWKKYTRGPGEWVTAETKGAEGLLSRVQGAKGVWQGSDYLYRLSKSKSSGCLFIQRFPGRGSVI